MKKLGTGAVGTGGGTLLYTVPTGMKTDVRDIVVANTTASAINCSLHLVPTGASATAANAFFSSVSIPANTTVSWSGTQTLNAGDFIQGIGGGAGLTVHISGDEYRDKV